MTSRDKRVRNAKYMILLFLFAVVFIGGYMSSGVFSGDDDSSGDGVKIIEKPVPSSQPNIQVQNYTMLYNDVKNGVVTVYSGDFTEITSSNSQGSGFIYDNKGHIITNHHVVEGNDEFHIRFRDGSWSTAERVGVDESTDIAVLKANSTPDYTEPLPVSDVLPKRGARVIAVGSPTGLENSLTSGVVSGLNRTMESTNGYAIPDTIQSDASLSVGNSGGPLIDMRGAVVGINRAKRGGTVSLAVSPRIINQIVPVLINKGEYNHAFVGIRMKTVSPLIAQYNDISADKGVLVEDTVSGSPASSVFNGSEMVESSGGNTVPVGGDVIIEVDGNEVFDTEDFSSYIIRNKRPGDRVNMTINRNGETKEVSLILASRN
jgi:S1-C subfamily serine protease